MPKKKATTKAPNFEEALERLEQIVSELEGGELALEKALELFEEGVGLGKSCGSQLAEAEKKLKHVPKTSTKKSLSPPTSPNIISTSYTTRFCICTLFDR